LIQYHHSVTERGLNEWHRKEGGDEFQSGRDAARCRSQVADQPNVLVMETPSVQGRLNEVGAAIVA
jgi:hypothetical protein